MTIKYVLQYDDIKDILILSKGNKVIGYEEGFSGSDSLTYFGNDLIGYQDLEDISGERIIEGFDDFMKDSASYLSKDDLEIVSKNLKEMKPTGITIKTFQI